MIVVSSSVREAAPGFRLGQACPAAFLLCLGLLAGARGTILYRIGCRRALLRETDDALAALREAVRAGFSDPERMLTDPDLESVRSTGIRSGFEVVSIDGMTVHEYASSRVAPYCSASTQQGAEVGNLHVLPACGAGRGAGGGGEGAAASADGLRFLPTQERRVTRGHGESPLPSGRAIGSDVRSSFPWRTSSISSARKPSACHLAAVSRRDGKRSEWSFEKENHHGR